MNHFHYIYPLFSLRITPFLLCIYPVKLNSRGAKVEAIQASQATGSIELCLISAMDPVPVPVVELFLIFDPVSHIHTPHRGENISAQLFPSGFIRVKNEALYKDIAGVGHLPS